MDERGRQRDPSEAVATDLVEYLIVAVPDQASLEMLAPALVELVRRAAIRILDLVTVTKDLDGSVATMDVDAIEGFRSLGELLDDTARMLSDHDVELASLALAPSSAAVILVTEDRWAEPLSAAARRIGGRIVAGERIPASRVEFALADQSRSASPSDRSPLLGHRDERWTQLLVDPTDQINALADLLARGLISSAEFEEQKARVLDR